MGIFDKRVAFKPFEYPDVTAYKDAINHSYWLVSEWNFISDVHDFNVKLNESEKNVIKNTLLAISQIEVSVKKFWTKLGDKFPKPEFEQVGVTFGESEVRHADAYSHLLQVLNLNDDFHMLLQNPVIQGRVDYLTKYLKGASDNSNENFTLTLALFSIFIENVSLFSQFVIIKSFNKYMNILKDIDNVVQATQQEECYVEGTEILTPSGWKLLSDINIGDEVFQYNEGRSELVKVSHVVKKDYVGEVYNFYNNVNQCIVTPNHEMVSFINNKLTKTKAKDFDFKNAEIPEIDYPLNRKIEHYEGKVYCVTVPSGVICTRYKDKLMIAGNCIHALLGVYLINCIQQEQPDWFNDAFYQKVYRASKKAFEAECKIIDWIFEKGELSFLSKDTLKEFIKNRFNESVELIGGKKVFEVDDEKLDKLKWFNDEIYAEMNTDFFHKKPVTYSKKVQSIKAEDIF